MSGASAGSEAALCSRLLAGIHRGTEADPHLAWRARHLHAGFVVEIGSTQVLLRIDAGRVTQQCTPPPLMSSWDFAVRGSVAAWEALWRSPPPAGWHDLFALAKRGEMRFEGDLHPFLANLQYFKDLLTLPRTGRAA